MKLIKTKERGLTENYLELHYDEINDETKEVISRLDTTLSNVEGTYDEKHVSVPVTEVLYFDTVDRKTFAYTDKMCIEMRITLRNVLDNYSDAGLIRISKSAVVNVYKIDHLQGDINMRTTIFLKNGEKLVMNRGYKKEFMTELERIKERNRK
ncbi:LytTR family DNA-binding domain-containing protein [Ruminococcus flavefaciens]|uniref:LytTR family DNA-binding domain-containing protein n=1 Tax=Ruminococcus flavefaciens TaxID=1265 RepID=UPI000688EE6A|nr:LytTR family DNA-binding domain-containing protein [Ruminococcus flavefaciens]